MDFISFVVMSLSTTATPDAFCGAPDAISIGGAPAASAGR